MYPEFEDTTGPIAYQLVVLMIMVILIFIWVANRIEGQRRVQTIP
jgi:hypothetical protein